MILDESTEETPAGSVTQQHRKAAVVYNPTKVEFEKLEAAVLQGAENAGWAKTLFFKTDPDDFGVSAARLAIQQGADVVMAVGGDGTVRAVAEGLRDSGIPLALLPSGTGNLLARNLDFSVNHMENAIAVAFGDHERQIDLGLVEIGRADGTTEEHAFVVMAGFGLDAKMMAKTNSELKKRVGWLAYVDGGVRAFAEIKPFDVRYRVDGGPQKHLDALTFLMGNCGLLTGGLMLIPDAKVDDGILDVVVLRPRGPLGPFKVWRKIAWDNGVLRKSALGRRIVDLRKDVKDVRYMTGKRVDLRFDGEQEVELDGDEFGMATGLTVRIDAGALRVKVP